jgi:hypothetical protein
MPFSPFMDCVTVGASALQLSALIAAIDSRVPVRCGMVRIEFDLSSTGNLYVGNSNVAPAHCAFHLVPTQEANIANLNTGLVLTSDIWLVADGAGKQVNITAFGIGM